MPKNYRFSVRIFIFFCMAFVLLFSIPGTGYFMMQSARDALIEEKQSKLFALAKLMDDGFKGTFEEMIHAQGLSNAPRGEKIRYLNNELKAYTDHIAGAQEGVGVGYYSANLDAIITYGPSSDLGKKVGQSISADHLGREVMKTGIKMVQTAPLVRGRIMNCMYPIIREDKVVGYIWANELVEDINIQVERMKHQFYFVIALGILVSVGATSLVANYVSVKFTAVKNGLRRIQGDLDARIPPMGGEIGEIGKAINEMAQSLSERKRLERQMERADRLAALGETAAGVAHEVKNPITAVKGFIQLIEEGIPEKDPNHEYIGIAISEINRLDKIVEQLLYYSRPSESKKVRMDINRIIDRVLPLVGFRLEKAGIVLVKKYHDDLPPVLVDEEQIKQVLLNLIINSTQAMEQGGRISISTGRSKDRKHIRVRIEDTGKGIDPENMGKLFNPFFTTRRNGTGLGLAVSHRIMELHHGEISAASTPLKGTAFLLCLPIPEDAETAKETNER
ncbi:MAG: ATP-binding protein [Desulfobacter sp.]